MAFDDEDNPSTTTTSSQHGDPSALLDAEEPGEDLLPDFSTLTSSFSKKGVSSKAIRKGEKDFESHGTNAQVSTLERSRRAMEDVLSYTRTHRTDAWCRGWYFPDRWEAEPLNDHGEDGIWARERVVVVEHEKGGWLATCGRTMPGEKGSPGVGRLWLLPEEALHLLERGNVDVWWPERDLQDLLPGEAQASEPDPDNYDVGLPLSLEAAYAMLIGDHGERGKITLPKYQVYAHLKRSGYIVLRAPTSTTWQTAPPPTLREWLFSLIPSWERPRNHSRPPYGPLVQPGLYRDYRTIWSRLDVMPRHKPSPYSSDPVVAPAPPFQVFWHVWKPGGPPFSKRNPPPPDFRIAVADTAESAVPTLEELDALLQSTPWDPPPPHMKHPGKLHQRLKHGYRNVLIAVVDAGLVNFMRFGEGAFGEDSLVGRFDGWGSGRGGGKRGGRGGARGRGRGRGRGGRGGRGGRR